MTTHQQGDDSAPYHPIPAATDQPTAPGRDHDQPATDRDRRDPQPARTMALAVLILAVIGGTAVWQLLGPAATAGLAVALLMAAGAVIRWRQGARPDWAGLRPPAWSRPDATSKTRPAAPRSRPSKAPRPAKAAPRPAQLATPVRQPALPGSRSRPGRSAATNPTGRAGDRTRPADRKPARQRDSKAGKKLLRKALNGRGPAWWGRGTVAVLITPLALILSAATALVGALRPQDLHLVDEDDEPEEQEEPDDEPAEKPEAPAVPQPRPGPPVTRPAARPTTSSGSSMSASPAVHAAAEAVRDHIGGFVPQNAADLTGFVSGLHEVFEALSDSLAGVNTRFSDEEPVHPAVVDHLEELRSMLASLVDFAAEAGPIFNAAHEADLERLDNPRPGEEKMDYSQQ